MTRTPFSPLGLIKADFMATWYAAPQFGPPIGLQRLLNSPRPKLTTLELSALDEAFYANRLRMKLMRTRGSFKPCHDEGHAGRVCERAIEAFSLIQELIGNEMFNWLFPRGVIQATMLGLAGHDHGHPGAAWTEDADQSLLPQMPYHLPHSHSDYSLEYLTAYWNDEDNERDNIPLGFRIIETYIAWASSNGGATERGKRLGVDTVKVEGFLGWLMRAVDITITDDFINNTIFETKLIWVESLGWVPRDRQELIDARYKFLTHIESTYDNFDAEVRHLLALATEDSQFENLSITEMLGWRHNVRKARRRIEQLAAGDVEVTAIVQTIHHVHGGVELAA